MSDALEAIDDIVEALDEYGTDITLNIITEGTYNPATGSTTDVTTAVTTKAFISNYQDESQTNTEIKDDDVKFTLYYNGAIKSTDTILYNSKVHKIQSIVPKVLQNENLMYLIRGRV
jgi:hypothetical protein